MVEKISVAIELAGGELVRKEFEALGETGSKAFKDIDEAAKAAGGYQNLDPSELADKFKELGIDAPEAIVKITSAVEKAGRLEVLAGGIKSVENAFENLGNAIEKVGVRMTRALGPLGVVARTFGPVGIAIGVAAGAFLKFGDDAVDSINQVDASAAKLGITFQQFDKLKAGFEEAGISSGAMADGLQKLQAAGFNAAIAMPRIIAQLQAMPDGVNRTNLAISLLGEKLGVELVAALRTGSLSLEQFNAATGTLTERQRIAAAQYQQSLNQLKAEWNRFIIDVAAPGAIPFFDTLRAGLEVLRLANQLLDELSKGMAAITPRVGIDISLTGNLQSQLDEAKAKLDQIGQAGKQTAQQGTIAFTSWGQAIKTTGEEAATTGQQGTIAFTTWGQAIKTTGEQAGATGQQIAATGQAAVQAGQQGASMWSTITSAVEAAGTAIGTFASSLGGIAWDAISSTGVAAWNALVSAVEAAGTAIGTFISSLTGITWDAISSTGAAAWNALVSAVEAAGTAIGTFITSLTGITWDAISSTGAAAWNALVSAVQPAISAVKEFASSLAGIVWDAISSTGVAAWNALTAAIKRANQEAAKTAQQGTIAFTSWGQAIKTTGEQAGATGQQIATTGQAAVQTAQQGANAYKNLGEAVKRTGSYAQRVEEGRRQAAEAEAREAAQAAAALEKKWEELEAAAQRANFPISQLLKLIPAGAQDSAEALDKVIQQLNQMMTAAEKTAGAIEKIGTAWVDASGAGFGTPGAGTAGGEFAGGGFIGGRGTGTSDSNLAWVSRGEHIMPARAVRQPGVLSFLEALRHSSGNLRRVLDGMGRFALGGVVPKGPLPAFASGNGGGASAARVLNLNIEGRSFGGLSVPESTAASLERFAVHSQIASTGRKPSWRR